MTITPYPGTPPSMSDPTNFAERADQAWAWLAGLPPEINAVEAMLGLAATRGALSIPMTFSTTTSVADPGAGTLRLNNAVQTSATAVLLDLLDSAATDRTAFLDTFDDASNPVKGQLGIMKAGDPSKWLAFNVTAVASPSGYRNLTVANIGGSSVSPFADGDAVIVTFARTGDKGDTGPVGSNVYTQIASYTVAGTPATVDLASIPSTYADLLFVIDGVSHNAGSGRTLAFMISPDGTSFSGDVTLASVGSSGIEVEGAIFIPGYRRDVGIALAAGQDIASSPGILDTSTAPKVWRCTGGISAVRFTFGGGGANFDAGTITLWGR